MITQKFWRIKNVDLNAREALSKKLKIHPAVAQLLLNRGISSVEDAGVFLSSDLSKLHDPYLLKDMDVAVNRIKQAQRNKECVMLYGDYDVDGVTSVAILQTALAHMGIDVIHHIPHRMNDGYGLNDNISGIIKENEVKLLICADCGITAIREVEALNKLGIDIIIIDHHEPAQEGLPKALAVIDPKRKDCSYPFSHLASVGLSAKLIQALSLDLLEENLDLIALGTIADVVPLKG
jgi:single-stranded-DNA-specific exonuclease